MVTDSLIGLYNIYGPISKLIQLQSGTLITRAKLLRILNVTHILFTGGSSFSGSDIIKISNKSV